MIDPRQISTAADLLFSVLRVQQRQCMPCDLQRWRLRRQGGADLENGFSADLHLSRFGPPWFADKPCTCGGYGYGTACTGFAVVGCNCRRLSQDGVRRFLALFDLQENMAAGHAAHVKPPVVGACDAQAQLIIVGIRAPGQNRPAFRQGVGVQPRGRGGLAIGAVFQQVTFGVAGMTRILQA